VEPTSRSGVRASDDYPGGMRYQASDDSSDEILRKDFQRVTNCAKRNVLSLDDEPHFRFIYANFQEAVQGRSPEMKPE
jgi:hypothetical protein